MLPYLIIRNGILSRCTTFSRQNMLASVRCMKSGHLDNNSEPSYIKVPVKYTDALKKKLFEQEKLYSEHKMDVSRINRKKPLITCRNQRLNHYEGQCYPKWSLNCLVSCGWRHMEKSLGDFFTLLSHGSRPDYAMDTHSFEQLGLSKSVQTALEIQCVIKPTTIQTLAIPCILSGKNTILSSETGGGKTYAYLAPIVDKLLSYRTESSSIPESKSPSVLILAPSRELCYQISTVSKELCSRVNLTSEIFLSDTKADSQMGNNCDIVISTPGYISKLLEKSINGQHVRHIILDEADTQLDASFSASIMSVLTKLSLQTTSPLDDDLLLGAQVILVSATLPQNIDTVFGDYLPLESFEIIKSPFLHRILPNVSQKFIRTSVEERPSLFVHQLKRQVKRSIPTLVFCNTNQFVSSLSQLLTENHLEHGILSKSKSTLDRQKSFSQFQNGDLDILVVSDLASRGLDTLRAQHVINYDFPYYISDYLHRIGRVGRLGSLHAGFVFNYITRRSDVDLVQHIEASVRRTESLPGVDADIKSRLKHLNSDRVLSPELLEQYQDLKTHKY